MNELPVPDASMASAREREHLERAHNELCSALTILRSHVALVRVELRQEKADPAQVVVHAHLSELDMAVDRLSGLAALLRTWHAAGSPDDSESA